MIGRLALNPMHLPRTFSAPRRHTNSKEQQTSVVVATGHQYPLDSVIEAFDSPLREGQPQPLVSERCPVRRRGTLKRPLASVAVRTRKVAWRRCEKRDSAQYERSQAQ